MSKPKLVLRIALSLAAVLVVFLLSFILGERFENKTFSVSPPVEKSRATASALFFGITKWDQDVFIQLSNHADPTTLLDFRIFGNLHPERDPEPIFGKATQVRTDDYHIAWYRYPTPLGYAEAGCEKRMSAATPEEVANAPCFPMVYGFTDKVPESVFREPLQSQIHQAAEWKTWASWREFIVFDSDGSPILFVRFKSNHLEKIGLSRNVTR